MVTLLGIAGSFGGSLIASRVPQAQLKKLFGIFLIVMGAFILAQSAPKLLSPQAESAPSLTTTSTSSP
jgi:uncharacterized membrane protein YfcA